MRIFISATYRKVNYSQKKPLISVYTMFIPKAPASNKEISDDDDETMFRSFKGKQKTFDDDFCKIF